MATVAGIVSPATFTPQVVAGPVRNSRRRKGNVVYIEGLNSFGGLKAHNKIASLGLPICTQQSFAKVVSSLKAWSRGGGALSTTCNSAEEIFKIAAIMNGLVLIGVAFGFVLLRIEVTLEEE